MTRQALVTAADGTTGAAAAGGAATGGATTAPGQPLSTNATAGDGGGGDPTPISNPAYYEQNILSRSGETIEPLGPNGLSVFDGPAWIAVDERALGFDRMTRYRRLRPGITT